VVRAEEGGGGVGRARGRPERGAHRGGRAGRRWRLALGRGRACVAARGGGFLLKRPAHSLGTGGRAEYALGDARGRTTREWTAGPGVRVRGSGCEAFPVFEASGDA
jgi:hypothetical protein